MNNKKYIKDIIDSRLSEVNISKNFEEKLLVKPFYKKRVIKKTLALPIAICICAILSVPVIAANISKFDNLKYIMGTPSFQFLQPIELYSEDNGIKMEVIAAMNDDKTAIVYLTIQDLTGDRIDETIDLYNYSINGATMFTHELVSYDESTKTATLRMIANGGNKLNGKKVTVRVRSFLSGKEYFNQIDTHVILSDVINKSPKVIPLDMNNIPGGGGDLFSKLREKGIINILNVDEKSIVIPNIDFVKITNIGYVDGRLHIQTKWNSTVDDHGFLYLVNTRGDSIQPSSVTFGIDDHGSTTYGKEYLEYIYDIESQDVSSYSLYGSFVKNNNYTTGKWETTFEFEAVDTSKRVVRDVELGDIKLDEIMIQPLGIEIRGDIKEADRFNIEATMDDGTKITYNHAVIDSTNGEMHVKYFPTSPTKIENMKELRINGMLLHFN